MCTLSPTIYISPTEEDYEFDNSTFKFDGCSRSCVNVTIINDMIAEPLTRIRRDTFDVALTGSNLDGITLSPDTARVYIYDDDCTSFLCGNCICTYIVHTSLLYSFHLANNCYIRKAMYVHNPLEHLVNTRQKFTAADCRV